MGKIMKYEVTIKVLGRDAYWTEVDRIWKYDKRYIRLQNTKDKKKQVIVCDMGKLQCEFICEAPRGWDSSEWLDYLEGEKAQALIQERSDYAF